MNAYPPPGWYPDVAGGGQRYWDGQRWTEFTVPGRTEPAPGQPSPVEWAARGRTDGTSQGNWFLRHKILGGVLAFIVVVFLAGAVGAVGSAGVDPSPGNSSAVVVEDSNPEESDVAEPDSEPIDTDGDGVVDEDDFRPNDANVQTRDDLDTDDDGVRDGDDFRPKDSKVQTRDDVDTDHDGIADYKDDFPKNPKYSRDTDGDRVADQLDDFPKDPQQSKDTDGDRVADPEDAFPQDPSRSRITLAMENALASAQDYLEYSAFSRQGLIDQLSSEFGSGFKVADATWAVDELKVDWKQQAVKAAREYLEYSPFSRQGLIEQLSSPYGSQFTLEQATYAVNKIGL